MLRLATEKDIPEILRMAFLFHQASPYAHVKVDGEKALEVISSLLSDREKSIVILLEHEGRPVGVLAGTTSEILLNRQRVAAELIWWVNPEHRGKDSLRLLEAFEFWAKKVGCVSVQMVCLDDQVAKLYERRGYKKCETSFMKDI